jgi:hypothetical protein
MWQKGRKFIYSLSTTSNTIHTIMTIQTESIPHVISFDIALFHTPFCRAKETHANINLHIDELAGSGDFAVCTITPEVEGKLMLRIEKSEENLVPGEDKFESDHMVESLKMYRDKRSFWEFWGLQFANPVNFIALTRELRLESWLIATHPELCRWLKNATRPELDAAFEPNPDGEDFEGANSITADWFTSEYGQPLAIGATIADNEGTEKPLHTYGSLTDVFGYRILMRKLK